jgi:hypothetical protein
VEPFAGDHRPPLWLLFVLPGLVAAVVTWSTWPDYSNCVTYGPLGGLDLLGAFVAHGLALVGASYAVLLSLRAPHIRRWSLVAQCTLVLFLLTTVSLAYVATVHGFWPPPTPDCKNVAL